MQNKNYNVIQETKLLKVDGLCILFSRNKHINILQTIFFSWNEWLKLPIKYPDIPRHAQVCFTNLGCVWSKESHPSWWNNGVAFW